MSAQRKASHEVRRGQPKLRFKLKAYISEHRPSIWATVKGRRVEESENPNQDRSVHEDSWHRKRTTMR